MFGGIICPKCEGNGFRKIFKEAGSSEQIEVDCQYCKNQGEVDITEEVMADLFASKRTQ